MLTSPTNALRKPIVMKPSFEFKKMVQKRAASEWLFGGQRFIIQLTCTISQELQLHSKCMLNPHLQERLQFSQVDLGISLTNQYNLEHSRTPFFPVLKSAGRIFEQFVLPLCW